MAVTPASRSITRLKHALPTVALVVAADGLHGATTGPLHTTGGEA
jgi:hypothetical protein